MKTYAKGRRAEYRAIAILEAAGYSVTRAASSKGLFDVVALGPAGARAISVKSGTKYASSIERELLQDWRQKLAPTTSVEIWRFPDRAHDPLIEVL